MLEKCVWTDRDYEVMGWHDATVHALAIDWDPVVLEGGWHGATLLLDIDYIVSWGEPQPDRTFRFQVAPATLAFEDAWDVEGGLRHDRTMAPPQILDLRRGPPENPKSDLTAWHIEGDRFELRFEARGFSQHFRSRPIANGREQSLTSAQRGGPSFARPAAF
jgi:hypothetical protein